MSLQFNVTASPYNGIVQRAEVMVYGPDGLGRISGNATQLGLWTTRFNNAYDKVQERILQVSGHKRQFDDVNHSDTNTHLVDIVNGTATYKLTTDDSSNLILDIYKVYAKTSTGNYRELDLVNELEDPDFYSGQTIEGAPTKYSRKGSNFTVSPTPDENVTDGLKFEISREGDYFTTADTTQKPGFRGTLHQLIPDYAVLAYAEENVLTNVNLIERRVVKLEAALDKAYSKVAPDERDVMKPRGILYK